MTKGAWINEEGVLVVDMAEADKLWNSMTQDQQYRAMCAMFDPLLASATDLKKQVEALEARVSAADKLAEAVTHEREMVCQDFGMQQDAATAVHNALAAYQATKEGG